MLEEHNILALIQSDKVLFAVCCGNGCSLESECNGFDLRSVAVGTVSAPTMDNRVTRQ